MNKCLNCGESVKNKYCNVSCQNKHQKRKQNPEQRKAAIETRLKKWKIFDVKCFKCDNVFKIKEYNVELPKKEKYYCSSKCSHSRTQTKETKEKISSSVIASEKFNVAWKSGKFKTNKNGVTIKTSICDHCNLTIEYKWKNTPPRYHQKCWLSISGGFKPGSSRGKSGWYKGYWCDSSYELAWVMYALDNDILFTRNTNGFKYIYENKEHLFYPDFILEDGTYLEIKNFHSELTNAKINYFPHPITVWYKENMKQYIEYAKQNYGKDYINLYQKINLV